MIYKLTIKKAKEWLANKEFSSAELTKACLDRIKETDETLRAFVTITEAHALEDARRADELIANGDDKPLLGIPFVIKDNFSTVGVQTSASSNVLRGYVPPFDATVVAKLKEAGMVMLGKTNMDAFAHGSSTETSDFGTTKNPWNPEFLPGGSSGGTGASVAADQAIAGIGSETAGSIRQPAAWCGIVGLKPTYGRVSRYGVVAMASSTDSPGPMTKIVEDSALVLNVLAGKDPHDATSSPKPTKDYTKGLNKSIKGRKIGISAKYIEGIEKDVLKAFEEARRVFEKLGASVVDIADLGIDILDPQYSIGVYTILQRAEVSSNLARFDGIRYGNDRSAFGDEAKRRIMLGTYTLSAGYYDAFYKKALKVRTIIVNEFHKMFEEVDAFIAPTSPSPAMPLGSSKNHPMFGEMADVLVEPSSIAGLPGINVPAGFSSNKLPIGLQVMGTQFAEDTILNLAHEFEANTEWHLRKPEL
ncbi:MAG: Asp-tRNA(Asn)/Glu-tRNA(Gln) amidotransferase subunit GatA [Candidatus Levybacteria bacterium]|nr:Asp-tRNA(Asn)/Glu-tRNA(Gln) amidotransferase subunit GatA [Candidatus Levybacteria bacterium]